MVITPGQLEPEIRLLGPDDIPAALRIENECYEFPWDRGEFEVHIGASQKKSYAAKSKDCLLGYMAYELIDDRQYVRIRNIAVDKILQHLGVGRTMINYLEEEYAPNNNYESLVAVIRETNLDGQLFFKQMGFICTKILHEYYFGDNIHEPAYLMKKLFKD